MTSDNSKPPRPPPSPPKIININDTDITTINNHITNGTDIDDTAYQPSSSASSSSSLWKEKSIERIKMTDSSSTPTTSGTSSDNESYNDISNDQNNNTVGVANLSLSDDRDVPSAGVGVGAGVYHPPFMFCRDCTSCNTVITDADNGSGSSSSTDTNNTERQSNNSNKAVNMDQEFMSMLTRLPHGTNKKKKKKKKRGGGATMMYISPDTNIVTGDDDGFGTSTTTDDNNNYASSHSLSKATLYVSNLVDESQILLLTNVLEPSPGVASVSTQFRHTDINSNSNNNANNANVDHDSNAQSKTVTITFDPLICPDLNKLVQRLNELGLITTILHQPSSSSSSSSNNNNNNNNNYKKCRSTIHVEGICCASEVPIVTEIVRQTTSSTNKNDNNNNNDDDNGIQKVSINISSRLVYVQHNPDIVSIQDVVRELNAQGFGATIRVDGYSEAKRRRRSRIRQRDANTQLDSTTNTTTTKNNIHTSSTTSSNYVESTLLTQSMSTTSDAESIRTVLKQHHLLPISVRACFTHVPSRTIKIEHDPRRISAAGVAKVVADFGGFVDVVVHVDGEVEGLSLPEEVGEGKCGGDGLEGKGGWRGGRGGDLPVCYGLRLNIVLSGICWLISMMGEFVSQWEFLKYFGLPAVFFGLPPVVHKAFLTIRRRHFDANCMMVIAALGALALSEYEEAASVAFLFSISEYLENRATQKARIALDDIVHLRPDRANLLEDEGGSGGGEHVEIVSVEDLEVGSRVSVRTGDKVPADGVVISGSSQIDESSLTGEARPVDRKEGDSVSAGTINVGLTRLIVRTTSSSEDSAVSRLIRLVEEAQSNRSPTEKIVDSFARSYTPVVVGIALIISTIPWLIGGKEVGRHWTLNGLILVVIACPCALTISTPVTYAAGLAAAAQKGILVKGGAKLEALGCVRTVLFDKTGTLTEGKFKLKHLETVGNSKTREEVLRLLATMEAPSSHPLAATLVDAAKNEGVKMSDANGRPLLLDDHTILRGEGVTAILDGHKTYVGNVRLFQRLGYYQNLHPSHQKAATQWNEEGATVGFLGIDTLGIVAMFSVCDSVRKEARHVVQSLQAEGIEVIMLSGDGDGAARAVGKEVGINAEHIHSQFLPEDKLHFLANLQGYGAGRKKMVGGGSVVCSKQNELMLLCGDGVNDAPALAIADVGVAMGEGAAVAMEMGDVTLMDCNLEKLLFCMRMGARVIVTVKENIAISVVSKLIVTILTFCGKMSLFGAIASDVGVMLLVSVNGMKLLPGGGFCCLKWRRKYTEVQTQYNEDADIV